MNSKFAEILENSPEMITGRQLRAARVLAELTQAQLAQKVGVSAAKIAQYEKRRKLPIMFRGHKSVVLTFIKVFWEQGVCFIKGEGVSRAD